MKAGKEGPMKKNFPKEFAKKAIASGVVGGATKSMKGKGTGYIPKNTPQTKHQSGYIPQAEGRADYTPQSQQKASISGGQVRLDLKKDLSYIPQSQRHKYPKPKPPITGGFDPNLAGPNFNKNKNVKPTVAKKKK